MVVSTISRPSTASIEERAARYPQVTDKLARSEGVSSAESQRMFEEALKFMEVAVSTDGPVAPSRAVDPAWHHFILFTRDYAAYCERYLGRFIHHDPTPGGDGDAAIYEATRDAIASTFGAVDEELWPPAAAGDCKEGGNCKSDCTGNCSSS